jgi:hypothetical protein
MKKCTEWKGQEDMIRKMQMDSQQGGGSCIKLYQGGQLRRKFKSDQHQPTNTTKTLGGEKAPVFWRPLLRQF